MISAVLSTAPAAYMPPHNGLLHQLDWQFGEGGGLVIILCQHVFAQRAKSALLDQIPGTSQGTWGHGVVGVLASGHCG